jgi:hypothetical protein
MLCALYFFLSQRYGGMGYRHHVAVLQSNSKYESGFVCFWWKVVGAHAVIIFPQENDELVQALVMSLGTHGVQLAE